MKQFYPIHLSKFLILALALIGMANIGFGQKTFTPASNNNITSPISYCRNITATPLVYTYNTCFVGTGGSTGTPIVITWYVNTVNAATGGTVVSTTMVASAVTTIGNSTYQPSTIAEGTLYYYCTITWNGTGTCNTGGLLTSAVTSVTITTTPEAITGSSTGCIGRSTTIANTVAGGIWSSSPASVAIVAADGTVGGVATGSATISYTIGSCRATKAFSVLSNPSAITGTNTVCEGSVTTLTDATASGTWSIGNAAIATVNASAHVGVTGILAGTTTITYTAPTGCSVTRPITVNATPGAVVGGPSACVGSMATLSNPMPGGTWTSSSAARATIGSTTGIVTTLATGTTNISYTVGTCKAGLSFVVAPIPAAIGGASASVCEGATITFTNSLSGGTWTSSNTAVASVSATGIVRGIATGSATITYTVGSCYAIRNVTVNMQPAAITGGIGICIGSSLSLSSATPGGIWSSVNTAKATIDTAGVITTVAHGTSVISYTLGSCAATITFSTLIPPAAIGGSTTVCQYATRNFTNSSIGGTWSSSNPAVAAVSATGVVSGVTPGTATITYSTGCGTPTTKNITVNLAPVAITGSNALCTGIVSTLTNTVAGGTWASAIAAIATINTSTGTVTPTTTGTTLISYTIGTCSATMAVTVSNQPSAVTGVSHLCLPGATTFTNAVAGGTWSSSSPAVANVNPVTGGVTGNAAGSVIITYAINSCISTAVLATSVSPGAVISSAPNPCAHSASMINISGTPGAVITYNIDGGANYTQMLTGGSYSFSTGIVAAPHDYHLVDVHDADCATYVDTTATINPITMQWIGGAAGYETEWQNAANWSCGFVPDSSTDITIPAGTAYMPVVPSATVISVKDLTIAPGVAIASTAGTVFSVKGSVINNGRFDGDGILSLNGTTNQHITGIGYVSNLQLNNTAGATIDTGSRLSITTLLNISKGPLTTNDSLVLTADSTTTARIGAIPTNGSVIGKVRVNQYIQGGYRRYRFISHPFSSSISLSQVADNIDITGTGGAANGFTTTVSNATSAFWLNTYGSNSTLGYDPGWRAFNKINASATDTDLFKKHQAIRLFFRGARGEGLGYVFVYNPSSVVLSMAGNVNQGDQYVTLAKGADATQDYNMIGNPYPSPVDIGTVLYNAKQDGQIVGSAFYLWDPSVGSGGQYVAVPIGTTSPIPYSIQTNAAFEVRAANDGDQLHFTEQNKTQDCNTNLLKTQNTFTSLTIYDTNYHMWDKLMIQYNDAATDGEDRNYDAGKKLGADFNFFSLSAENNKLAIDTRPYAAGNTISLGINSAFAQDFIIRADNIATPDGSNLYLHDKLLAKYTLLEQGTEYRFSITKDKETQGNDRFELSSKPGSTLTNNNMQVLLTPNPATDEVNISYSKNDKSPVFVSIIDMSGVAICNNDLGTSQNGNVKIDLKNLAAGIYIVEVTTTSGKKVYKLLKE